MPTQQTSVVVTGDDNVARPMAVALRSVIDTTADPGALSLYVLHQMSPGAIEMVRRSCEGAEVNFVDANGLTSHLPSGSGKVSYLNAAAWIRIFMGDLLPDVHRVLYLDTDTLVRRDVAELASIDLGTKAVAAAVDYRETFADAKLAGDWGDRAFDGDERYFNSGVMVCDLDAWRSMNASHQISKLMAEHGERITFMDQDVLNIVFVDAWIEIGDEWNNRSFTRLIRRNEPQRLVEAELQNAAIIHFATPYKPWRDIYPEGMGRDLYAAVESRTAYAGLPLEHYEAQGWVDGVYVDPS